MRCVQITCGPNDGGADWYIATVDTEDSDYGDIGGSGGARGPRSDTPEAWLGWVRRQCGRDVRSVMRHEGARRTRVPWSRADVQVHGWNPQNGHAPHGACIRIPLD